MPISARNYKLGYKSEIGKYNINYTNYKRQLLPTGRKKLPLLLLRYVI